MDKQADDSYYAAASEAAKESHSEKAISINTLPHRPDELELAGLVAPTEEESNTLRHVPDKIDWTAYSERFIRISLSVIAMECL
jgi:POT family proton-dependent oligopeptide transporter